MDKILSYKPQLNQLIYVGGCTGEVVGIEENYIAVAGVYGYTNSNKEAWVCFFKRESLPEKVEIFSFCGRGQEQLIWNFEQFERRFTQSFGYGNNHFEVGTEWSVADLTKIMKNHPDATVSLKDNSLIVEIPAKWTFEWPEHEPI